jgi:hypothetical protein
MTERKVYESDIEEYLVKQCAKHGAVAEKFKSPQKSHVPDRIVLWPDRPHGLAAEITFVECKRPGEKPTKMQARDHERRRALGFRVDVIDTYDGVDGYIRNMTY